MDTYGYIIFLLMLVIFLMKDKLHLNRFASFIALSV